MNENGFDKFWFDKFWNEHEKPKIYKEISLEILAALPDNEIEDAILNFIFYKFFDAQNANMRFEIISDMSLGFQVIWSTWTISIGILHGGFNEFFYNGSEEFTQMTLQALKLMGATEYCEILEKAIELHREEMKNPVMQKLYSQQTLDGYSASYKISSLKECDTAFYKLGLRLNELRVQYIRSNPHLFAGS